MYFAFNVSGWLNEQVCTAHSLEDAKEKAQALSGDNYYGLREVDKYEYLDIKASWRRK
jgi:hypothetical protein